MDLVEFADFVAFAWEKEREERIYSQWLAMLPKLDKYMDFETFKTKLEGPKVDTRTNEEIIAEIEEAQQKAGYEWKYSN